MRHKCIAKGHLGPKILNRVVACDKSVAVGHRDTLCRKLRKKAFQVCPDVDCATQCVVERDLLLFQFQLAPLSVSKGNKQTAVITQGHADALSVVVELGPQTVRCAGSIPTNRTVIHADDWCVVLRLRQLLELRSSRAGSVIVG